MVPGNVTAEVAPTLPEADELLHRTALKSTTSRIARDSLIRRKVGFFTNGTARHAYPSITRLTPIESACFCMILFQSFRIVPALAARTRYRLPDCFPYCQLEVLLNATLLLEHVPPRVLEEIFRIHHLHRQRIRH